MFNNFNHIIGAITIRINRKYLKIKKKPDLVFFQNNIAVRGTSNLAFIKMTGINAILDMRFEKSYNEHDLQKYNISYLRLKVPDKKVPTIDESTHAVSWINFQINNKKKILIHCDLGRGRGPLMSIIYLMSQGIQKEIAISRIKEVRKYTFLNKEQLQFIENFHTAS